jgi:uncharacterized protein YfaS (alpha-2-macroglobulin family)
MKLDGDWDFDTSISPTLKKHGVYVLEAAAVGGRLKRRAWLAVTDLAVIVKQSPRDLLVFSSSLKKHTPLPGTVVRVYTGEKLEEIAARLVTDDKGLAHASMPEGDSCHIVAQNGPSWAFSWSSPGYSGDERLRVFVYTERPIYRPNQVVYFKGIVREKRGSEYVVPKVRTTSITVEDSGGQKIFREDLPVDGNGSFHGRFFLRDETPLGDYSIQASFGGRVGERCTFQVSEYKKPEFKVEVSTDRKQYSPGEKIKVKAQASYYFGAPVVGAKITVRATRSAYRWHEVMWSREGEREFNDYGEILFEEEGVTDAEGRAEFVIDAPKLEYDQRIAIEASAMDVSRRTVTGATDCLVTRGDFWMYIETDKYIYEPGDTVRLRVTTKDYEDRPVAGQSLDVAFSSVAYKEVKEADGTFRTERVLTPAWTGTVTTDKEGRAIAEMVPKGDGAYFVEVKGKDRRGRTISDEYYLFVAGSSRAGISGFQDLKLILDRKEYHPGENAVVLVTSSVADCTFLLTVEGDRIHSAAVHTMKGSSMKLTLPVKAEYFPNVSVAVCAIRDGQITSDEASLKLALEDRYLSISITPDREKYSPGDEAEYMVTIKDFKGNPVRAGFSFGLVDGSIYALAEDSTPDIRSFFYRTNYNAVNTNYSFSPDYSAGPAKELPPRIRKDFPDTAYWGPILETGEDGKALVRVKLPDNLTTWVATVRAATSGTPMLVGSAVGSVLSAKDLLVRLEVPRFITQRDYLEVSGVIHNYTKREQHVKVSLEAERAVIKDAPLKEVTIEPEGSVRVDWTVAAERTGEALFTVKAIGQGASDAMELPVPVLAHGLPTTKSFAGEVTGTREIPLEVPSGVIPDGTSLSLSLTPSVAAAMMDGLEYLVHYPYGCVEQTMSALLPDICVGKALRAVGIRDARLEACIPKMVARGLKRIYEYHHADGGWGWWESDETHPYMTAYAVYGLNQVKAAGYAVNKGILKSGIKALKKLYEKTVDEYRTPWGEIQQNTYWNQKAYMLYALATCGEASRPVAVELFDKRDMLNSYTKALLVLILNAVGEKEKMAAVLDELEKSASQTTTTCHWEGKTNDFSWVDNATESTAWCLRAFIAARPESPLVGKTVRYLVTNRMGPAWESTKDTAAILYAMTDYLLAYPEERSPDLHVTVTLDARPVKEVRFTSPLPADEGLIKIPYKMLQNGTRKLAITARGAGRIYYSAVLTYYRSGEDLPAESQGITVAREYYSIKSVKQTVEGKDTWQDVETLIEKGTALAPGDRVMVKLRLKADRSYQYILVEDPLPAGAEVMMSEDEKNEGSLWYARREVRDEKLALFIRDMPMGAQTFTYAFRVEVPGDLHVIPARAYGMYIPEISGSSAESRITVK